MSRIHGRCSQLAVWGLLGVLGGLGVFGFPAPVSAGQSSKPRGSVAFVTPLPRSQTAVLLFLELRDDDDGAPTDWEKLASDADADSRFDRFAVATQTLTVEGDVIELDRLVNRVVGEWEERGLLHYDQIWLAPVAGAGILARELVLRQKLIASKVSTIAWYEASSVLEPSPFDVLSSMTDIAASAQASNPVTPFHQFVERQSARWLPVADTTVTDLHCANSKPRAADAMSGLGCRSVYVIFSPTAATTSGGSAQFLNWLSRLSRPRPATPAPKAVRRQTLKLTAAEPIRVDCGATTYATQTLSVSEGTPGRIVSAHALLEGASHLMPSSVSVRQFEDRSVIVNVRLAGEPSLPGLPAPCERGQGRVVVVATIEYND